MQFDVSTGKQSLPDDGKPQGDLEGATLLTVHEVAALLKVQVSWVYEHTRQGCDDPLPAIKIGKYLRFFRKDILDHLVAIRLKNHRHR